MDSFSIKIEAILIKVYLVLSVILPGCNFSDFFLLPTFIYEVFHEITRKFLSLFYVTFLGSVKVMFKTFPGCRARSRRQFCFFPSCFFLKLREQAKAVQRGVFVVNKRNVTRKFKTYTQLWQDVANKREIKKTVAHNSGQILFNMASCRNASLLFSY